MGNSHLLPDLQQQNDNAREIQEMRLGSYLSQEEKKNITLPKYMNVLITGSHHSGKSATINTILRVLNSEWNTPYGLHVEHAPVGSIGGYHTTTRYQEYCPITDCGIKLYDCAGYDDENSVEHFAEFFEKALSKGLNCHQMTSHDGKMIKSETAKNNPNPSDFCSAVVLVLCREDLTNKKYKKIISDTTKYLIKEDRLPQVVITGKNDLGWVKKSEIEREIQLLVGTRDIFWLENYVAYNTNPCSQCESALDCSRCPFVRNLENELQVYMLIKALFNSADKRFRALLGK